MPGLVRVMVEAVSQLVNDGGLAGTRLPQQNHRPRR